MIRKLLSILTLCICCQSLQAENKQVRLGENEPGSRNGLIIEEQNDTRIRLSANFDAISLNDIESPKGEFCELIIDGTYKTGAEGEPKLPAARKLLQLPQGAVPSIVVNCYDTAFFPLSDLGISSKIVPHQPSVSKSEPAANFKHKKRSYRRNRFTEQKLVTLTKIGTMRGTDLYQIAVNPVKYNPKQNTIMVMNNIGIEISFDASGSKASESTYNQTNTSATTQGNANKNTFTDLTKYPVKYLIITDTAFVDALEDFIRWKRQKGFEVIVGTTDTIGKSSAAIKEWITARYNSATNSSPAPSFLLLAADTDKIPTSKKGEATGYGTDLYYACMDGDDDIIPDIYYGRFSARTAAQMKAIADKTIDYEKYQFEDPTYLSKASLIAGYDGSYRSAVGIPTLTYITQNRINETNGFLQVNKFTTKYTGCYDDSTVSVGLMTYTAHGSTTTWVDPELSQSKVRGFGNSGKTPFVIANCCLSGCITTEECLGETWIRKENGGAVAYIGSSPKTYWQEDFYWAVGAHNYKSGVCPDTSQTSMGALDAPFVSDFVCGDALLFAGNLAVTEAHDNNYPSKVSTRYYWEGYNFLGDPSLLVYFGEGKENTVSHESFLPMHYNQFTVNALSGSYVALSKNGTLLSAAIVAKGESNVTLQLPDIAELGDIDIVVTKAQYKPYFGKATVIMPNESYLTASSATISNSNILNGSRLSLDIVLCNVGQQTSQMPQINISSKSQFIKSISLNDINLKTLGSNESDTLKNICTIELQNGIADQTSIPLEIAITENGRTTKNSVSFKVNAPKLVFGKELIFNSQSQSFNPGDTVDVSISLTNTGHAILGSATVSLQIDDSQFISAISNKQEISDLQADSTILCNFKLAASAFTPMMTSAKIRVTATETDIQLTDSAEYTLVVGQLAENIIGTSTSHTEWYPFNNYYKCGKTQILYTADDLGNLPVRIDEMALSIAYTIDPKNFSGYKDFKIKIKPVSLANFDNISDYVDMSDAQTVYSNELQSIDRKGLQTFVFDSPFIYDGTSNFVVEMTWGTNESITSKDNRTKLYCHTTTSKTVAYDFEDEEEEIYLYKITQYRPNTVFRYQKPKIVMFRFADSNDKPLINKQVTIDSLAFTTDSTGIISLTTYDILYNKDFKIDVENFGTRRQRVTSTSDTTTVNITLDSDLMHIVYFHVTDSETNENIFNAAINIGETTIYTDSIGTASTEPMLHGSIPFTVEATNYFDQSGLFEIESDTSFIIQLTKYPNVTVRTLIGTDFADSIAVTLDSTTILTDNDGSATFENTVSGIHKLNISYPGYYSINYDLETGRTNIDTTIQLRKLPSIKFVVYGDSLPLKNAKITIDEQHNLLTDSTGAISFTAFADNLTHNITIEHADFVSQNISLAHVESDTIIIVTLNTLCYPIQFYLHNQDAPLPDIAVELDSQSATTDTLGRATIYAKPTESAEYKITLTPEIVLNGTIAVNKDVALINIDLANIDTTHFSHHQPDTIPIDTTHTLPHDTTIVVPPHQDTTHHDTTPIVITYKIKFYVSYSTAPVSDVTIVLNNKLQLSDKRGMAVFEEVTAGTAVNYIVAKEDYTTTDGKIEISDTFICNADTTIYLSLNKIRPPVTAIAATDAPALTIYPNPSDGLLQIQNYDGQEFMLFDMNGRKLKTATVEGGKIDLRPIPAGTYTLTTIISGKPVSTTIIIR